MAITTLRKLIFWEFCELCSISQILVSYKLYKFAKFTKFSSRKNLIKFLNCRTQVSVTPRKHLFTEADGGQSRFKFKNPDLSSKNLIRF